MCRSVGTTNNVVGLIFCLLVWSLSGNAFGHLAGITDTSVQIGHSKIKLVYTTPTDNLAELFPEQALESVPQATLRNVVVSGFSFLNSGALCKPGPVESRQLSTVASQQFIVLFDCSAKLDELTVNYSLFFDRFNNHENFTRVSMGGKYISFVFTQDQQSLQIPVKETLNAWGATLTDNFIADPNENFGLEAKPSYFPLGIEHILLGFDHLLFLFALLLVPLKFKQLVVMVTSFTIAHSITLAVAVFDLLTLPALWVEAVIALSIVYVGLENLVELRGHNADAPLQTPWRRRVVVTFCFGLIHGFGFSYVLKEIGLGDQVASALLFFNLGVEAGQLMAVAVVFPCLIWINKKWPTYGFSRFCSGLVILMGGFWLVERVMSALSQVG